MSIFRFVSFRAMAVLTLVALRAVLPVAAADPFQSQDIGALAVGSTVTAVSGGYNITAGGTNIVGAADQFAFNYQQVAGDFDFKIRVAGLSQADSWSKAGLMARDNLQSNSVYACTFASPSASGAYFQFRSTIGGASSSGGLFPVNYPNTWLRLQRTNNLFTSYASLDGVAWFQLGAPVTLPIAATAFVGMAVTAAVPNGSAVPTVTAQFRDFQTVTGAVVGVSLPDFEPPGPSTRKSPFAITEIMYNPAPRTNAGGASLEYLEIYNSNPFLEEISRFRLSGDVDYTFPQGTFVQGGRYIVVAKDPAAVAAYYGLVGVPIFGPYTNTLSRSGTVRLRNNSDGVVLEILYSNNPPWPTAADGTGHSLVLARPSYGQGSPAAWAASDAPGGSPGRVDSYTFIPQRNVVINEFLANSISPTGDYIELYNHSTADVDLAGCSLSDDPRSNKFIMGSPTVIPARGFAVFRQSQLGFGLNSGGERIYFRGPDGRVLDAIKFEAQAQEVASGRFPDGAKEFYPLTAQTPGAANAGILIRDIVINEIMYKPISGSKNDEYVELYNKGTNAVSLGGWAFVDSIDYTFPSNIVLNPDSYLVIARDVTNLLARYPGVLNAGNTLGNFKKSLPNRGGRLALGMPDQNVTTNALGISSTNTVYVVVDEVTYGTGGNWGKWANEGGSSLELVDPRSNHRLAHNWVDSDETHKAPWTTVEASGPMVRDFGYGGDDPPTWVEVQALNEAEFLVDNVEAIPGTSATNWINDANSTFSSGLGGWVLRGTHIRSSLDASGGYGDNGPCLHVRTSARGDTAANRCLVRVPTLPNGSGATLTLRARVRWLKGWPETLLRTRGDYMEAFGRLTVPTNLGTPGQRNSRAATNAPPAIYEVKHSPIVPAGGQAVVVSARVDDPDGLSSLSVRYRIDPSATTATVAMNDNGVNGDAVAGDGIYSATIPGQAAGALVAFQVIAADAFGASRTFPLQDSSFKNPFECLIYFGDTVPATGFGTYRQWMTSANLADWQARPALSNERLYETFVYGNFRVVYNAGVKWSGSPYHQFAGYATNTSAHYSIDLPLDNTVLGTENFNKIHAPGNGPFGDQTIQREQICYWMARQLNLPWGYRRYVNMFFNGNRRGGVTAMMEDSQTPGADMIAEFFPNNTDGNLYKLQPWFEQDDPSSGSNNRSWCTLLKFTTISNGVPVHRTARYRQSYLTRGAHGTANDYQAVFDLVEAASSTGPAQAANFSAVVDVEEYFRILAVEHASGNWDAVGSQNQQNMYGYHPDGDKWRLMIWDWNIVLGSSATDTGSWGPNVNLNGYAYASPGPNDTNMAGLFANPPLRRIYLRGLKELARGPMQTANIEPPMDAKYRAFLASGITPVAPGSSDVKSFLSSQRTAILNLVTNADAASFHVTSPLASTSDNNLVVITGEAPFEARTIKVNGIDYPITWTSVKAFRILLVATNAANDFLVQGYDVNGKPIAGFTADVTFNFTGTQAAPENALVLNEIMYNPATPEASYVEIFNRSDSSFDLSGWQINGVDFKFPLGSIITNHQYLVLTKNRAAFGAAYGGAVSPAGEFNGQLDNGGETISLERPVATLATNGTTITTNVSFAVVNRVRYDDDAPWPPSADGFGPSLQLIDASQDNRRVSNWSDHEDWRFASYTGTLTVNVDTNFFLWLSASNSDLYIDDIVLVTGLVAQAGQNLLSNGGFESPLTDSPLTGWIPLGSHINSSISTQYSHSGNSSLHIVANGAGGLTSCLRQDIPAQITNTPATVSFWFRPTTNASQLTTRTRNGSQFNGITSVRPTVFTPGAPNTTADTLPPYDPLWLNEVQPNNLNGIVDNFNEHDPWIELYNAGSTPLNLSGYYLGNNYSNNLTAWPFPPGAAIAPGEYKIIWADGQPGQTAGSQWHTSFKLNSAAGSVALVRLVNAKPQITDYLNYSGVGPDLSYGDFPNGQPIDRQIFFSPTPGSANVGKEINVFINEWMASNTNYLADPADGKFDDWFELYNGGAKTVDLGGYWLTDNLLAPRGFRIPDNGQYTIPAGGWLLVWADNETNENTPVNIDLHADFQLSKDGEQIGLFAPNGFTLIDGITFGTQTNNANRSEGRFPDGGPSILTMNTPSPRGANSIGGLNAPPAINPIANRAVTLGQTVSFTAIATDPDAGQTLSFSLVPGFPAGASITTGGLFLWTPSSAQTPSVNTITVKVTDNGVPPLSATRSFTATVSNPPRTAISKAGNGQFSLSFDTLAGHSYRVEYKNSLTDPTWITLKVQVAGGSSLTVADDLGVNSQRFYRIVQLD